MVLLILIVSLFVLLALGLPVAVAIGFPSLMYLILTDAAPAFTAVQRFVAGVNTYTLLAIPFFIFAGNLMNEGGVSSRIFGLARSLVGHMRGGLGHVNVVASVIFAGKSGAAIADAGGLGAVLIRSMREAKYPEHMTIGITASSSTIGPMIPPSMVAVIYAVVANTSVGWMFAAGIIPGFMMALAIMVLVALRATKELPRAPRASLKEIFSAFLNTFWALLTPIIIIGGIFVGVFTPTEAAAVASLYAIVLGLFIYGDMDFAGLRRAIRATVQTTVQIMLIVASATLFAWVLTRENAPQLMATLLLDYLDNYVLILIAINVFLIIIGCFMETVAAINILVPVLLPIATTLGMHPVQFGIMMILNLMIGVLSPPFGSVLFVLSSVADLPVERVAKYTFMYIFPLLVILVLIAAVPAFTLWLPSIIFAR